MKSEIGKQYIRGVQRALPVILGFVPVAITFAILAMEASLTKGETVAMSVAVFAGASQIMAVKMLADGTGMLSIVLATFVLNLRHIIMSTCVFKKMKTKRKSLKLLTSFGVTDESFALFTTEEEVHCTPAYMLGLITVTYLSWIGGTVLGVFVSVLLPDMIKNSFAIALYALFIALITPDIKKSLRLFFVVVITAVINFVLSFWMDSSWAIILSTLLGALIGVFLTESKKEKEERV